MSLLFSLVSPATVIGWVLKLFGVSATAASALTPNIISMLSAVAVIYKQWKAAGSPEPETIKILIGAIEKLQPHLIATAEEEKRAFERGQLPADQNHDFPQSVN